MRLLRSWWQRIGLLRAEGVTSAARTATAADAPALVEVLRPRRSSRLRRGGLAPVRRRAGDSYADAQVEVLAQHSCDPLQEHPGLSLGEAERGAPCIAGERLGPGDD